MPIIFLFLTRRLRRVWMLLLVSVAVLVWLLARMVLQCFLLLPGLVLWLFFRRVVLRLQGVQRLWLRRWMSLGLVIVPILVLVRWNVLNILLLSILLVLIGNSLLQNSANKFSLLYFKSRLLSRLFLLNFL